MTGRAIDRATTNSTKTFAAKTGANEKSPPRVRRALSFSELYAGSSMYESGGVGIGSDML